MDAIPPTYSFRVAQAYGVRGPAPTNVVTPAATPTQAAPPRDIQDRVELSAGALGRVRDLVAARVPQRMDFATPAATPSSRGALVMHASPAARNAAATGVALGHLDVTG
jgi:hypothetical protein